MVGCSNCHRWMAHRISYRSLIWPTFQVTPVKVQIVTAGWHIGLWYSCDAPSGLWLEHALLPPNSSQLINPLHTGLRMRSWQYQYQTRPSQHTNQAHSPFPFPTNPLRRSTVDQVGSVEVGGHVKPWGWVRWCSYYLDQTLAWATTSQISTAEK